MSWSDSLLDDIAQALTLDDPMGQAAWFDRRSQEVVHLPEDFGDDDLDDDAPEWRRKQRALRKAIEDEPKRWQRIEGRGARGRLRDFLDTIDDPELLDALHAARRGARGAYRRVRDVLHERGLEQLWYDFEEQQNREMALDWLEEHGI